MIVLIILLIILGIVGGVSYLTAASVYRTLVKKDNPNARTFQVLIFIGMFVLLLALLWLFVVTNLRFER